MIHYLTYTVGGEQVFFSGFTKPLTVEELASQRGINLRNLPRPERVKFKEEEYYHYKATFLPRALLVYNKGRAKGFYPNPPFALESEVGIMIENGAYQIC